MSVKNITSFLTSKPSYLKWGNKRLAEKFSVDEKRISKIKEKLSSVKATYLDSL